MQSEAAFLRSLLFVSDGILGHPMRGEHLSRNRQFIDKESVDARDLTLVRQTTMHNEELTLYTFRVLPSLKVR